MDCALFERYLRTQITRVAVQVSIDARATTLMQQHVLQSDAVFNVSKDGTDASTCLGRRLNKSDTSDSHRTVLTGLPQNQWQVSEAGVRWRRSEVQMNHTAAGTWADLIHVHYHQHKSSANVLWLTTLHLQPATPEFPQYPTEHALRQVPTLRPIYILVVMQANTKHWCDVLIDGHGVLEKCLSVHHKSYTDRAAIEHGSQHWQQVIPASSSAWPIATSSWPNNSVSSYRTVNTIWTLKI
jgi:hypothetical protein